MKKFTFSFLALLIFIITIRSGKFLYQSLDWPLSYCIDMVLMKFFAWSLDRGLWPYTDILTYNLPMTVYINWVALKLFGENSFSFRLLDVTWLIFLSGITFVYLKNKIKNILITVLGASLCLTLSENATNFGAFQRETMMLPFWVLSLYSYDRIREGKSKILHGLLLGFYICFSALIKPTGFLLLIFILAAILWEELLNKNFLLKETLIFYSFIFIGGLIVLFCSALPFLIHGTLFESVAGWFQYFKDLSLSLEIIPFTDLLKNIFSFSLSNWFIPFNEPLAEFQSNGHFSLFHLSITFFYLYLLYDKKVNVGPFLILLSGFLNYFIQAKGFAYHLFPVWFGYILLIVCILDYLYQQLKETQQWKKILSVLTILLIGITLISQQNRSHKFYKGTGLYTDFNQTKKELRRAEVLETLKEISVAIKNKPIKIQVFEAYHSITLNSVMDENMRLVSKYPEAYIFYNDSPEMNKYKLDMIDSLKSEKPDIIVLNRQGTFKVKKDLFETFPDLALFLKNYALIKEIREINNVMYSIYVLNSN